MTQIASKHLFWKTSIWATPTLLASFWRIKSPTNNFSTFTRGIVGVVSFKSAATGWHEKTCSLLELRQPLSDRLEVVKQTIFQVTWVDAWVQVVLPSHWCEPENFGKPSGPLKCMDFPEEWRISGMDSIILDIKDLGRLQNRSRWSWRLRGSQGAWLMIEIVSELQKNCLWHLPQVTQTFFFTKIDFQTLKTLNGDVYFYNCVCSEKKPL